MTSKDGTTAGKDSDGIWYLKDLINEYITTVQQGDRVGVFWAGGATTSDDFDNVFEFVELRLNFKGKIFSDVFNFNFFQTNMGIGATKNNLYWRAMNRASKSTLAPSSVAKN